MSQGGCQARRTAGLRCLRPSAEMKGYQRDFIEFAIAAGVLRFGTFTLKSGRRSPYFFNSGLFCTGGGLARLGEFYAAAIEDSQLRYDMLFGPAYKGIPLVAATGIALANRYGRDLPYAFNRKEAKAHGEGGTTVGAPLSGRILIIDDVITAGTSVRESVSLIRTAGATPCAVVIALDRKERGSGAESAAEEVRRTHGIPVVSIVTLADVVSYLRDRASQQPLIQAIESYQSRYGTP